MHAFLSNLANRQTDRQTRTNAFTSSFIGGNNTFIPFEGAKSLTSDVTIVCLTADLAVPGPGSVAELATSRKQANIDLRSHKRQKQSNTKVTLVVLSTFPK